MNILLDSKYFYIIFLYNKIYNASAKLGNRNMKKFLSLILLSTSLTFSNDINIDEEAKN